MDADDLVRMSPHLRVDLLAYLEDLNEKSDRLLKIEAAALKIEDAERMASSADRDERSVVAAVFGIKVDMALAGNADLTPREKDQIDLMIERASTRELPRQKSIPRPPEEKHDPNESIDSIVARMGSEVIDMPLLPAPKR
jgi:hypothetical protein